MQKILIIGLGLIGGSFAKAIRENYSLSKIYACDENHESLNLAKNDNNIDKIIDIKQKNIDEKFDLIIISANLNSYQDIFTNITKNIAYQDSLIIDIGSVKSCVKKLVPSELRENFIACHPIAGSNLSDYQNSQPELFQDKKFIICQNEKNKSNNIEKIIEFVEKLGFKTEIIDHEKHDKIFALTSHLPQFISFLTKKYEPKSLDSEFLTKSFRLNYSNPKIWSEIFAINENNIEHFYLEFHENMMYLLNLIEEENFNKIISEAKLIKSELEIVDSEQNITKKDLNDKSIFRFLLILSYLKIKELKEYKDYFSTGFYDFTLIINFVKIEKELIQALRALKNKILDLIVDINS